MLAPVPDDHPIFVKLDTQGTEMSILSAAEAALKSHRILGVELEATLLAEPADARIRALLGSVSLHGGLGYELLDLKLIRGPSRLGKSVNGKTYLNECDAVFGLRTDMLAAHCRRTGSPPCSRSTCAMNCTRMRWRWSKPDRPPWIPATAIL